MKRKVLALICALSLVLAGCGSAKSPDWADGMTVIAPFLASEGTEDFTFGESADTLGLGGVYYATWTNGDKRDFINAAGESTVIFNSQIYVIAQEFRTEAEAKTGLNQWMAREKQNYNCNNETTITVNGREYTILQLISGNETNPYGFGHAAFTIHGNNVICVELVC